MSKDTTDLLNAASKGDRAAAAALVSRMYDDLRGVAARLMQNERAAHTLQPTALVNEAYTKLVDQGRASIRDRTHFRAVAATIMRRILVDHARARAADKRGGGLKRVQLTDEPGAPTDLDVDLLGLDAALDDLGRVSERQRQVVEMKFFGGMEVTEIADSLGVSEKTVKNDWRFAKAWLQEKLGVTP